jgi:hypothetical protein
MLFVSSCDNTAVWLIMKLRYCYSEISSQVCSECMSELYERCRSHQIIRRHYMNGEIKIENKYCTVVYK